MNVWEVRNPLSLSIQVSVLNIMSVLLLFLANIYMKSKRTIRLTNVRQMVKMNFFVGSMRPGKNNWTISNKTLKLLLNTHFWVFVFVKSFDGIISADLQLTSDIVIPWPYTC